ncbi:MULTISPECIES: tetratricopeptide repeat-containing sulfotransferase family protein [Paraburkholderia]|uniref:tetratricopeptide repeat-containing sulfotransferase family protein n=1 Tax=Paraburkholderia TaxID=1822464 RepID=UPI00224F3F37|nr:MULTISPECIES: sulfotransferase [Paraburkholderia]MCX4172122.1 sulfotransferase [Paraburkholderia madseniana]MDQ6460131.1 sulfotransferase [Paraburkholderia madseniana]
MKHDTQPATASAWSAEGDACAARGDLQAALQCFETARAHDPVDAVALERLAATLAALNRFPEAVIRYHEGIGLDSRNTDLRHGLGWSLEQMHRLEQAVDAYREAVRLNPKADGSYNNMGNCLQALGRFDESHEAYRRAIEAAPQVPLYYRNFVQSKRLGADDPVFAALEQLVGDAASLTPANQAEIHFAYGQALSDVGRNDASFDHFLKGNALHRAGVRYDEAASLGLFAHLPELLTSEVLAAKHGLGDASDAPIFIVGMPRSGSTLIEQILASHPQVFGAGERTEFGAALVNCIGRDLDDPLRIDIEALQGIGPAQLRTLGADYLHRIRTSLPEMQTATPGYARFTDKYPFNFINVGLIHLALPKARFIHSSRSPLQSCLSIFARIFHDVPFSYDLGELGRYYRAYDALMVHWQRVLPEGTMIEVKYEELIEDFEGNVRRLLAHCGLDWDERCLAFHQTTRQVNTASAAQVRRPLYKTSLQRWQPQQALLQPLFDGLGPELAPAGSVSGRERAPRADAGTAANGMERKS